MKRLLATIALCLLPALASAQTKRVLTYADFEYIGAFYIPSTITGGGDMLYTHCLAVRYVNGVRRFLVCGHKPSGYTTPRDGALVELNDPGVGLVSRPKATVARVWGDIYQDKEIIGTKAGGTAVSTLSPFGLLWDEPTQRLLWSYLGGEDAYHDAGTSPTLGVSRLDEATGVGTAEGAYTVVPVAPGTLKTSPYKSAMRGALPIPQAFADAHLGGGRWIAVGFGGYFSQMSLGGVSLGPSLWAVPMPVGQPHLAEIQGVRRLLGTTVNTTAYTRPMRGVRDADYHSEFSGDWPPKDGVGYWTWYDTLWGQLMVWIDLPDAHGLFAMRRSGQGRLWYENSDRHAERVINSWDGYNPDDLASVLHGTSAPDLVRPVWQQTVTYLYGGQAKAATFDPVTRTLFVLVINPPAVASVYAWRLRDLPADLLPAAAGGIRKETP